METKTTKTTLMEAFIWLYDNHTKSYPNAIEGISDKDANNRLGTKANHMAWIAGSLVQERFALANAIGITQKQTSNELFQDHKGIQDGITYPSLAEFKSDWEQISPALRNVLTQLGEEQLNAEDPFGIPGGDYTLFDLIGFIIDRESYCIGQIGLYRRLLGYEAMKWT
ncbi:DinB family protein [Sinomicrobium weinanense]|uniref:DinB family protein n=1 Tax=Sinomicrobium weinanense TaxID=2842200 RepID=A0A926Q5C9_9FLAO|nr:DinB family protein [Sinomicrobium weinanense]MBC9797830.1 DinB family protein [Sinomicrobium weinanense]MBU3124665.1 hypothetical protein [Sinomicrobium weinanense]